jgi:hypothetical protein
MCEFCAHTQKERTAVRDGLLSRVEQLDRLAERLRSMAYGRIKPHTEEAKAVGIAAQAVIRFLAEDWL